MHLVAGVDEAHQRAAAGQLEVVGVGADREDAAGEPGGFGGDPQRVPEPGHGRERDQGRDEDGGGEDRAGRQGVGGHEHQGGGHGGDLDGAGPAEPAAEHPVGTDRRGGGADERDEQQHGDVYGHARHDRAPG
ncbi:hypothetical protein Asi02nite_44960 [Asanoa siamensis]|uniref:Uncharacterized protein n=1 Tax=Asanoa siamensis TaxID=926357 RepID=A0ABQ4CVD6_9ACTN|nr:hypothetical protein [Asanoa siamensis]GIF74978.1 hypothetical protein Asi02nite_44960 [Asanoa siamensis]